MRPKVRILSGSCANWALSTSRTTGWEPSEEDRQLAARYPRGMRRPPDFLRNFRAGEGRFKAGAKPFASGAEAYEHSVAAHQKARRSPRDRTLEKSADELRPWGEFSPERTKALASQGIVLRYFFTPKSNYDKFGPEWSERYMLSLINRTDSTPISLP